MIEGTNKLARASIIEAVAGEETTDMGTNDVQIKAGRFGRFDPAQYGNTTTTWSLNGVVSLNPALLKAESHHGQRRFLSSSSSASSSSASASSSTMDLSSVTWRANVAPFNTTTQSTVQTVHLSSSGQNMVVNGTQAMVVLELKTFSDPRIQGCRTYDTTTNNWVKQGVITTGWYSATNTSHAHVNALAGGVVVCASSHLSDFATVSAPVEIPEINTINVENDFILIENYNPTNMYAVYVLIGLFVGFVALCGCAHRYQQHRYAYALKQFEFVNYRSGPQDFEGAETPSDGKGLLQMHVVTC
jgi:hypothetical protein